MICIVLSLLVTQHSIVASYSGCSVYSFQNYTKSCDSATMIKFYIEKWDRIPKDFVDKTQQVHVIDVMEQNISALENKGFCDWHSLSTIFADMNNISTLPSRMLSPCHSLKELTITRNNITEIYDDAFHGLSVLVVLDLSINQISSLSANVFKPLKSLTTLRMNNNYIVAIDKNHFVFNEKLKHLEIGYNSLTVIDKGSFWKLKKLLLLKLCGNPALNDVDLSGMDRLQTVYIHNASLTTLNIPANVVKVFASYNQISTVNIEPNGNLEELFLDQNLFRNFEGLSRANKLNVLYISDNNITDMNFAHLMGTQIHRLSLAKNPIKSFNVTDLLTSLPELRMIKISFQTLDKRTLLDLNNQTHSKHIQLSNSDQDHVYPFNCSKFFLEQFRKSIRVQNFIANHPWGYSRN